MKSSVSLGSQVPWMMFMGGLRVDLKGAYFNNVRLKVILVVVWVNRKNGLPH
ncbi:hypothetical protein CRENPOLYSF2_2130003 [Crenothrix polyspora]|uniref:Uncharacterized protein n=1 Tax=Crenothrix polyspora TaxID=360316 RepID=A0A1R4H4Y9_9GAMM|nr:hypothetical protein CRENPOLYSF2_2130003 [Crenothrix polyspora]